MLKEEQGMQYEGMTKKFSCLANNYFQNLFLYGRKSVRYCKRTTGICPLYRSYITKRSKVEVFRKYVFSSEANFRFNC